MDRSVDRVQAEWIEQTKRMRNLELFLKFLKFRKYFLTKYFSKW